MTFLWREWADGSQPGSIDISHKGPCAVYMKAVQSAISDPGNGAGWFKIWDSGYDSTTSQCRPFQPSAKAELMLARVHREANKEQRTSFGKDPK